MSRKSRSIASAWKVMLPLAVALVAFVFLITHFSAASVTEQIGWCCKTQGQACIFGATSSQCMSNGGNAFSADEMLCAVRCGSTPMFDGPPSA